MKVKASADFSEVVRQAAKVGKESGKLFTDNFNLAQGGMFAKSLSRFKDLTKKVEKLSKDAAARDAVHKLGLAKKTHDLEIRLAKDAAALREKINKEADKAEKKALLEKYAAVRRELRLVASYNKDSTKFLAKLEKSKGGLTAIASITRSEIRQVERATESLKEASKWIDENLRSGSAKVGENLTEAAENFGETFVNGIDVTALTKKLSAGLGKGLGKAGDLLGAAGGGGGAAGNILKVLGAAAGALSIAVGALGALLVAFVMLDKKVKEFNKDIVRTHGALSVMNLGAGNLNAGLRIVKKTVQDLSGNLGVTEDEAKALFASLDNGNITLARITGGTRDAHLAQLRLTAALRDTYTAANMTGVGLSEYADNLTNYVNDLGMSTETVNDNFRSIAKMASESGFSTRRFYSMVVQAASGQSALNVSLEQTGDLLLRMSKIMGMKKAAEMVGGAAGGMGQMSAQERLRTLVIAGGRGQNIFQRQATQSADTFTRANHGLAGAFSEALARANLTGRGIEEAFSNSNPRNLVQSLSRLSASDQRKMLTELRNSGVQGTEEMARQLEEITNLSRGDLGSRVGAGGSLGAGANLQMQASLIRRFMDPAGRLSAPQRVKAESVTGMGGPQMDAFLSQMQAMTGDFEAMRRGGATGDKLVKEYQLTRRSDGSLVDQLGHEIRAGDDLFMTRWGQQQHDEDRVRDEATSIAYETMDATTSVADILENKVAQYIQMVYDWLNGYLGPLLLKLPGLSQDREQFQRRSDTASLITKEIEKLASQSSEATRRLSVLGVKASSGATPEERAAARTEIAQIQQQQADRQWQIQGLRDAGSRVRSGTNTYDTRVLVPENLRDQAGGIESQLSPEAAMNRIRRRLQITGAAPVSAAAPGTVSGAAPGAAPTTVPSVSAPAPTRAAAETASAPVVASQEETQQNAVDISRREIREDRARERREAASTERLLSSRTLGDGLADSRLPDAIAEADARMRLLEGLYAPGGAAPSADVISRLLSGTASETELAGAGLGSPAARALRYRHMTQDAPVNDFISQNRGGQTVITPIHRGDQVLGMRAGGPVATGRGGGGTVNIAINGGDERRVFDVVRRAMHQAGVAPSRVPGGR